MRQRLTACVTAFLACLGVLNAPSAAENQPVPRPASTFRADLPLNTWVRVRPAYAPVAGGGSHRPQSWNKLVYDSLGRRAIFLDRWSDDVHDHSIYANAVLAFDVAANEVTRLKVSNWKRESNPGGGYRTIALPENESEPTPCDRHPYGNVAFVPERNAVYLSAGANQTAWSENLRRSDNTADTWRFDLAERKWTRVVSEKNPPGGFEGSMCYDPVNKVIVRVAADGTQTWLLDVATEQWRNPIATNNPRCGKAASMCYDSKRGRVLLFGGRGRDNPDKRWNAPGVDFWSFTVAENEWKPLPDSPIRGRAAGMDYDPANDCVMLHFSIEKGKPGKSLFYLCDRNEWRGLPAEVDSRGPAAPWHALAYDAANNVFVRSAYTDGRPEWWLIRLDRSSTVPISKE